MSVLDSETLLGFSKIYLQDGFDEPAETPKFHKEVWDYCCSDYPMVAIAAPRKHSKTTIVTGTYVLGSIVFRDHDFILIVSDTESQAKLFLETIRKEVTENEKLMADFKINPIKPLDIDSKTDIIINFLDGHQARVIAKGSNAKRGTKWGTKRPNLIVGDDMENDELVENPIRRRNFRRWIRNSLIQSLSKTGKIRIIGTILHHDSALNNYMPDTQTPKQLKDQCIINTPNKVYSTYDGPEMVWQGARYRAHPDIEDYSSLLWPENYNEEWYIKKYYEFLADNDTEGYAQEYLSKPTDESKAFFKANDLLEMKPEDFKKPKKYYCGVDFAITQKTYNDWTVFATEGIDEDSVIHITDIIRRRMETFQIINTFFDIHALHPNIVFIVEKGMIWETLKPILYKEMSLKKVDFKILPVGSIKDKKIKARIFQHRTQAHMVRFDKDAQWWPECEMELKSFDKSKFDDQVDALAIVPRKLHILAEGNEEDEENPYEDDEDIEDEENLDDGYDATDISPITGY